MNGPKMRTKDEIAFADRQQLQRHKQRDDSFIVTRSADATPIGR